MARELSHHVIDVRGDLVATQLGMAFCFLLCRFLHQRRIFLGL